MDSFWSASAQEALPHAVSRLQESLTSQFRQVQGSDTGDSISAGEGVGAGKSDAQLVFEKRALEMHSKLVSHLTLEAQRRALDHFFEVCGRGLSRFLWRGKNEVAHDKQGLTKLGGADSG
jgi:hypothetical protein